MTPVSLTRRKNPKTNVSLRTEPERRNCGNKKTLKGKKKRKRRRVRRSRHLVKVIDFYGAVLLLYLRVLPGRLLLEVLGGRGDGRKLSSQDVTHRPLPPLSACWGGGKQSSAVNLLTPATLLSTGAASRSNAAGAQRTRTTTSLPLRRALRISWHRIPTH